MIEGYLNVMLKIITTERAQLNSSSYLLEEDFEKIFTYSEAMSLKNA